jgi:hypothetical protein
LAVLNSTPVNWYYQFVTSEYRGGYQRSFTHAIKGLPVPTSLADKQDNDVEELADLAEELTESRQTREALNLDLLDYIRPYEDGRKLADVGIYQPPEGVAESIIAETTETRDSLRVGSVSVTENGSDVVISLSARYKPEDEEEFETDRWGYTETELIPAMEFVGLDDRTRSLLAEFVEYAVSEGDGFANFRDNATSTTSLVDRLEELTLPAIDDIEDDLERYLDRKEHAEKLEVKISDLDSQIDNKVYELFNLDEADIQVIEEVTEG